MTDDPGSVRELRFRHGPNHIIVTVKPDGDGEVRVVGHAFHITVAREATKAALAATLRLISLARTWVFKAYLDAGGTVEELRD